MEIRRQKPAFHRSILTVSILECQRLLNREDADSVFLRNADFYLRVYTASKPRTTTSSSPSWEPQVWRDLNACPESQTQHFQSVCCWNKWLLRHNCSQDQTPLRGYNVYHIQSCSYFSAWLRFLFVIAKHNVRTLFTHASKLLSPPPLPGSHTAGDTRQEARKLILYFLLSSSSNYSSFSSSNSSSLIAIFTSTFFLKIVLLRLLSCAFQTFSRSFYSSFFSFCCFPLRCSLSWPTGFPECSEATQPALETNFRS